MDADFNLLANVTPLPFPDGNTYALDLHDHVILDDEALPAGRAGRQDDHQHSGAAGPGAVRRGGPACKRSAMALRSSTGSPPTTLSSTPAPPKATTSCRTTAPTTRTGVRSRSTATATGSPPFRHLDAVLKIDRAGASGNVAWILGGPCDQFGLTAAQKFSRPHHCAARDRRSIDLVRQRQRQQPVARAGLQPRRSRPGARGRQRGSAGLRSVANRRALQPQPGQRAAVRRQGCWWAGVRSPALRATWRNSTPPQAP